MGLHNERVVVRRPPSLLDLGRRRETPIGAVFNGAPILERFAERREEGTYELRVLTPEHVARALVRVRDDAVEGVKQHGLADVVEQRQVVEARVELPKRGDDPRLAERMRNSLVGVAVPEDLLRDLQVRRCADRSGLTPGGDRRRRNADVAVEDRAAESVALLDGLDDLGRPRQHVFAGLQLAIDFGNGSKRKQARTRIVDGNLRLLDCTPSQAHHNSSALRGSPGFSFVEADPKADKTTRAPSEAYRPWR